MKNTNLLFWFLLFCIGAFSCTDDGGSIAIGKDESLTDAELAFKEFLKENSHRFIHTTSGLDFVSSNTCSSNTEMQLDAQNFKLQAAGCSQQALNRNPRSFLIANRIEGFGDLAFISFFFNSVSVDAPPPTGTYYIDWSCGITWCYPSFEIDIYTVDSNGNGTLRLYAIPEKVDIVNENGVISVNFYAELVSIDSDYKAEISATLTCCL
ncbi:MAG TPA: hypothetical protein PK325_03430 [Cyclobacteriaceae bacterium]|nr:hypothetical protein [Cyclobacteriaceae bacterium]HMV07865.1 hypothetical protein [Cyclobacteriaceae bacterium]HMV88133.1 hypothetical protein [Cyclobacteriaceae bacterium]HMW98999.1 hypothetical protein [Cyclobacteriaceae bacterium]HMX48367.1 hypothetical protein [Cyclobacteriaceae bacterium]